MRRPGTGPPERGPGLVRAAWPAEGACPPRVAWSVGGAGPLRTVRVARAVGAVRVARAARPLGARTPGGAGPLRARALPPAFLPAAAVVFVAVAPTTAVVFLAFPAAVSPAVAAGITRAARTRVVAPTLFGDLVCSRLLRRDLPVEVRGGDRLLRRFAPASRSPLMHRTLRCIRLLSSLRLALLVTSHSRGFRAHPACGTSRQRGTAVSAGKPTS